MIFDSAGPNGSGKSTVADFLMQNRSINCFLNADIIALGMGNNDQSISDISAGRVILKQISDFVNLETSFSLESTISGSNWVNLIESVKKKGYEFTLCFVAVESVEISVKRVENRVKLGGHSIPEATIRRRYNRSLSNFFKLYSILADNWYFFDNSGDRAILLGYKEQGKTKILDKDKFNGYKKNMNDLPKNPEILKLLKSLETMPEALKEKERRYDEKKEFSRKVFEEAVLQSGLMEKLKGKMEIRKKLGIR